MPHTRVVWVVTTIRGDGMQDCYYCGHELNGPTARQTTRSNTNPGQKSTGMEIVTCPDCGRVIDGFSEH